MARVLVTLLKDDGTATTKELTSGNMTGVEVSKDPIQPESVSMMTESGTVCGDPPNTYPCNSMCETFGYCWFK